MCKIWVYILTIWPKNKKQHHSPGKETSWQFRQVCLKFVTPRFWMFQTGEALFLYNLMFFFYWRCDTMQMERLMNERQARFIPSCPWGVSRQPWGREGRTPPLPLQFHLIQPKTNVVFQKKKKKKNTSSCVYLSFIDDLKLRLKLWGETSITWMQTGKEVILFLNHGWSTSVMTHTLEINPEWSSAS